MEEIENQIKDVREKLLNSLISTYDKHLAATKQLSDRDFFEQMLKSAIEKQTHNGMGARIFYSKDLQQTYKEYKLGAGEVDTITAEEKSVFNEFIQYHNKKFMDRTNPQFYPFAVAEDNNKNLFLVNRFGGNAVKLEDHGNDTNSFYRAVSGFLGKDLNELKEIAKTAAAEGVGLTYEGKQPVKDASKRSSKYDISMIERAGALQVIIHEEGKVGPVEFCAQEGKDPVDKRTFEELDAKAKRAREQSSQKAQKGI